jgi:hypothetical protein
MAPEIPKVLDMIRRFVESAGLDSAQLFHTEKQAWY